MIGSWVSSRCGTFPPVDGFCVRGHAVEEVGDELGVSTAASGEAELPEFCGGTVVVVDRLIRSIGVDLAGAVAVDLYPDVAEKFGQLRFVVGAHAFARGAPLGFGGHDRDGTVFQPGRPLGPGLTSRHQGSVQINLLLCTGGDAPAHVRVRSGNVS